MGAFVKFGGWAVAVIAIVLAVILGQKLQEMRGQRDAAVQWKSSLESQIQDLTKTQAMAKAKTDEVEKKLEETTAKFESLTAAAAKAGDAPDGKGSAALKELAKAMGAKGDEKGGDNDNPLKGIANMFKGENGKAMTKFAVDQQMTAMYGQLFKDLNLPSDVEKTTRDIIAKSFETQMEAGLKALSGDKVDLQAAGKDAINAQKQLRDDLSKVLSADELAKYDQYQEDLPRHTLEQSYDVGLSAASASLKQESRDLIKQTLVEETLAGDPTIGKPGSASQTNPAGAFDVQLAAIDRARERLRTQLDEEQFTLAESFLNQQQTQAQAMRDVVSSMFAGDKKPAAKPK